MLIDLTGYRFFIRPGVTDLRKAINGLKVMIQNEMKGEVFSETLFLFCNRTRRLLKIVYWDRTGFCMWQKRLEKQKFPWPETEQQAQEISHEELGMLLKGIDFFHAHKEMHYQQV